MSVRAPDPTTLLCVAPNVRLRFDDGRTLHVERPGLAPQSGGAHTLAIVDAFVRPQTIGEVVARLGEALPGTQSWIDLTSEVLTLYRSGILVGVDARDERSESSGPSVAALRLHTDMLNDEARTGAFVEATRTTVRPDDVVVEVGTGSGVLAVTAAKAGARHVYAIEADAIADVADAVFRANEVADRTTLLRRWSFDASLPEPADVLIFELIGDGPLAERVIETLLDARRRFLKPGGRIVPRRFRLFGLPVSIPPTDMGWPVLSEDTVDRWHRRYRVNLTPLWGFALQSRPVFYARWRKASAWPAVGDPALLVDLDFNTVADVPLDRSVHSEVQRDGILNGVLLYFELDLTPSVTLSTNPRETHEHNHWFHEVCVLPSPQQVRPGDRVAMTYRYRGAGGAPDGLECTVEDRSSI